MINNIQPNQNTLYTKKGNSYQKEKRMKYIGLGTGAVLGSIRAHSIIKGIKDIADMTFDEYVSILNECVANSPIAESYLKYISSENIKELIDNVSKSKAAKAGICATAIAIISLVFFGVGVIVDKIINVVKAKKTDKKATSIQTELKDDKKPEKNLKDDKTDIKTNQNNDSVLKPDMFKPPFIK